MDVKTEKLQKETIATDKNQDQAPPKTVSMYLT